MVLHTGLRSFGTGFRRGILRSGVDFPKVGTLNMKIPALLAAVVALATTSRAQNYDFTIVGAQSNFTWTGTSSLGPIVGNPSNAFRLEGSTLNTVASSQGTATQFGFVSGAALVTPDIRGRIPNPLPFLPPLATLDVVGLTLSPASLPVAVAANGTFSANVILTATSGTLTVSPLGGVPSTSSLVGATSTPTTVNGTLVRSGSTWSLSAPINSSFAFSDPASGSTGSFTVVGTLRADYALVRAYCLGDGTSIACPCGNNSSTAAAAGCLNSAGTPGRLVGSGLPSVTNDTLTLRVSGLPATTTALLFQGTGATAAVFGDGLRCASGTIVRLGTQPTVGGIAQWPVAGNPLAIAGAVPLAGGMRTYQAWYRNSAAYCTASVFNLTNGVQIDWLP